jgi:hypothetical protein
MLLALSKADGTSLLATIGAFLFLLMILVVLRWLDRRPRHPNELQMQVRERPGPLTIVVYHGNPHTQTLMDFCAVNVRYLEIVRVRRANDMVGLNIVAVENYPQHPLHLLAVDRLKARVFRPEDEGETFPNGLDCRARAPSRC